MNESLEYAKMFAQFPFALRKFLREPLTLERAREIVQERMARRCENFLSVAERNVYGNPRSPYLALLKRAQCELGDLRALTQAHGLEAALRELRAAGVYIAFEEFKGRKPLVRGDLELAVTPRDFDNPFFARDFSLPSGGSTGAASSVGINLANIAAQAPAHTLALHAQEIWNVPAIFWYGILPDFTPSKLLQHAYIQQMPEKWFSHMGWRDSKGWLKFAAATLYMLFWMRLNGVKVRVPRVARVNEAHLIAQAMAELLQAHGRGLLFAQISRSVRVALAAQELGIDLTGATIRGGGEPITAAKVRVIEQTGARYVGNYATVETAGALATGCANPIDSSDLHLLTDSFALITHPHAVPDFGVTVPAFHVTSLLPSAPKLMLNVQLDDYGIVEERDCGCGLARCGMKTHLRQIRSYSKLTGEGVTLIGNDLIHILETVLPERFGGTPQDYQLLEQENAQGLTRLSLIISPRVKIENESDVIAAVLNALRESSSIAAAAQQVWKHAETLEIKRTEPIWTGRGKLLPLHLERSKKNHFYTGASLQ